jgi:hypothetical protein
MHVKNTLPLVNFLFQQKVTLYIYLHLLSNKSQLVVYKRRTLHVLSIGVRTLNVIVLGRLVLFHVGHVALE